jgi:hypothetical protein
MRTRVVDFEASLTRPWTTDVDGIVEAAVLGQTILWQRQVSPYAVHAVLPVAVLLQARAFYGFQIAIENIHSGKHALQALISNPASCCVDSGTALATCALLRPYAS